MSRDRTNLRDVFSEPGQSADLEEIANEMYGAPGASELNTGRVVAKPIPLNQIWANRAQPRRAIPASIGLHWNGNPDDVANLLGQWHTLAEQASGVSIDVFAVLQGRGDGVDTENLQPFAAAYVELLRLSASIMQDGLINPIIVIKQNDRYLIESGERRWLAHHVLQMYLGREHSKIPTVISDGKGYVWRQATENTARRELNAIGMARQLALLIMEARRDEHAYQAYDQIVKPGQSDRRFYAQVADGNTHRIPRGMAEKIQQSMNLSKRQIHQYRGLLALTGDDVVDDALWLYADVNDWGERPIRDAVSSLSISELREIVSRADWGLSDLKAAQDRSTMVDLSPGEGMTGHAPTDSPGVERQVPAWMEDEIETDKAVSRGLVDHHGSGVTAARDLQNLHEREAREYAAQEQAATAARVASAKKGIRVIDRMGWGSRMEYLGMLADLEGMSMVRDSIEEFRAMTWDDLYRFDPDELGHLLAGYQQRLGDLLEQIFISFGDIVDDVREQAEGE